MNKLFVWVAVLAIILIGGYWYVQQGGMGAAESDMGTYAYTCANGSQFTMSPSSDMASLKLEAGSQGMFTGSVTLVKMGDGAHYETTSGTLITFGGAGEEVQFAVGSATTTCNPVPSTESPPWNWGDAGEGGGVKQDVALIVSESIVGKWQSTEDAKFVREFKSDFTAQDWYEGKKVSSGLWVAFTKLTAPEISFPLEEDAVYVQMTMQGTQADTLNFKLTKLTPEELELIYMDRGGVLKFRSIK